MMLSDLLFGFPGVRLSPDRYGTRRISIRNRGAPTIYLDGMPFQPGTVALDDLVSPDDIEAIEIHRGAFIPTEFMAFGDACGVIAVWTR